MPFPDHPILRKELLTRLRSGKTFIALALWIVLNMTAMSVGWTVRGRFRDMRQQRYSGLGTRQQTQSVAARTSVLVRTAFHSVSIAQLLLAAMLAPAFAVGAFTVERKHGTYDMLLTTPLSSFSITMAKLASHVCVMVLLVLSSLPALSMVLLFGGVTGTELLLGAGLIVVAVLFFSSIGLLWSAWCRTTGRAALASYLTIGALLLLSFAPSELWRRPLRIIRNPYRIFYFSPNWVQMGDTVWVSPFTAAMRLAYSTGQKKDLDPVVAGLCSQTLFALLFAMCASAGARRTRARAQPRGKRLIADERVLQERRARFPYFLIDPMGRRPHIENTSNPMLIKELRTILFKSGSTWVRIFYVSTILHLLIVPYLVATTVPGYYGLRSPQVSIPCFECILLLFLAPIGAAGCFAKEKEGHTLDLLRTTLLTPSDMIKGKFAAAFMCGAPVLVGALLSWLFSTVAGYVEPPRFIALVLTAGSTYALAVGLSVLASVATGRTGVAFPLAYGFVVIMSIAVPWSILLGPAEGRDYAPIRWFCTLILMVVAVVAYGLTVVAYRLRTRS